MAGKVLKYCAGGNTALGFYSLFDEVFSGLDELFILKGGPGTGKSTLMKKIANIWREKGYDIEEIYCSSDEASLDGIIVPALSAGIVDGTTPHIVEAKALGAIEQYVNLGDALNREKLIGEKETILLLQKETKSHYEQAYRSFKKALTIHDKWESIYVKNMDFKKADQIANNLKAEIFSDKQFNKKSEVKKRFLGATTPTGPINFIENLTADLKYRYFIKGRAGTGKSTLQRSLITSAEKRGINMEIYYCGFDPKSIDMVVFRELGVAIFDSTSPHELFPSRDGDIVVDMYEETVLKGTDEKYKDEIAEVSRLYKKQITDGIASLANAKAVRDELEQIYIKALDFKKADQIMAKINKELEALAGESN